MERLFVYGTLAPERPNEHILRDIGGSWETATIKGILRNEGWGSEMGYPGISLDVNGETVEGFIFSSSNLKKHWKSLDEFEGEAYQRVLTNVTIKDGTIVEAFIYTLANN